jgi:hypothetical protein
MTDAAFAGGWGASTAGSGEAVEHVTRPLSF